MRGGYGVTPYGRSQWGNAASEIEPRFFDSIPVDHQTNVSRNKILKFETYCFSSWVDIDDVHVEISENGGTTFVTAFQNGIFVAPYAHTNSRYFRPDGQRLTFMINKNGLWNPGVRIVIRFTGVDEFGQAATKVTPITWE